MHDMKNCAESSTSTKLAIYRRRENLEDYLNYFTMAVVRIVQHRDQQDDHYMFLGWHQSNMRR